MATRNGVVSKFKFTYLRHRSKQRMESQQFTRTAMGAPEQWLIEAAASIGLDYAGLSHEITNFFLNHVINRHGHGPMPILKTDIAKIPAIVKAPDMAIIGIRRKGLFNAYAKRIDGKTFLYFDEVLVSTHNKALRGSTFYTITKPLAMSGFEKIVTMNGKSDLTKAKKYIAAGGHPGGEA